VTGFSFIFTGNVPCPPGKTYRRQPTWWYDIPEVPALASLTFKFESNPSEQRKWQLQGVTLKDHQQKEMTSIQTKSKVGKKPGPQSVNLAINERIVAAKVGTFDQDMVECKFFIWDITLLKQA